MPDLLFDNDLERLTVFASDPEGQALSFFWQPPPFSVYDESTTETGGIFVSRCDLDWSDDLDGQEITLTIVDAPPEQVPQIINLVWEMVAP